MSTAPKMLGRYELLYLLGQGGMGEVHLAKLTGTAGFEKLCIVKTILPQMQADPNFLERFHHEGRVLVQLNHANIAQVYDMGEYERTLYMAIEYVPGVDLSRVESRVAAHQMAMPVPIAMYVGKQMCEALGYAHRKAGADGLAMGIVHRDVSPQNVMVSYEGDVKVIDFGLAKSSARSNHTMPQTVLGKLGYMSPEQAMAKPLDYRSDIYSAGIVIWEMLAGRPLFGGGTMAEMVIAMANPNIPPLRTVRQGISPELDDVVMRALAKDPAQRYARADEFARALNELSVRQEQSVGAEDVGNYVKAMCPEEFAAERKLQSQLSVLRKRGSAPQHETAPVDTKPPRSGTMSAVMDGSTLVREPMTPAQAAMSVVAPPKAQPSSGAGESLVVPKSKTPMIVVGVLAAVSLAAGAGYVFSRPAPVPPTPAVVVVPPEPLKPAFQELAPVDAGAAIAEVAKKEHEHELIEVKGEPMRVSLRGGELFVILDHGESLKAGERLKLVGEPTNGTKRPLLGLAAVFEIKGALASLIVEDDHSAEAGEKLFAVRDEAPRPLKPAAPKVEVAKAETPKPVEPPKQVVEEPKPKEPTTFAEKIAPGMAKTEPAKAEVPAKKETMLEKIAPGIAKAEKEKEKEKEKAAPEEKPAKLPQLYGLLRFKKDLYGQVIVFRNESTFAVSRCAIRLPNQFYTTMKPGKSVEPKTSFEIPYTDFVKDPLPPDPQFANGWGLVQCAEGIGYVKVLGR